MDNIDENRAETIPRSILTRKKWILVHESKYNFWFPEHAKSAHPALVEFREKKTLLNMFLMLIDESLLESICNDAITGNMHLEYV